MQTNAVSNLNFQSKVYYISNQARINAHKLLGKMEESVKYQKNDRHTGWIADVLPRISTGKECDFTDTSYFMPYVKKDSNIPDFTLRIGKNVLNINSSTGQVLAYKKGFFSSLSRTISKAENYINFLLENFENSYIVEKHRLEIVGATKKAIIKDKER